jgi:hypothetical protein
VLIRSVSVIIINLTPFCGIGIQPVQLGIIVCPTDDRANHIILGLCAISLGRERFFFGKQLPKGFQKEVRGSTTVLAEIDRKFSLIWFEIEPKTV